MQNQVNIINRPRDIDSIPVIKIFNVKTINELVEGLCKEVLAKSENEKNNNRYGEVAIAYNIETGRKITLFGTMHHIELDEAKNPNAFYFNQIIQEAAANSVIIVHNHPNNMRFSFPDMRLFYENDSILSLVAVGNTEGVYVIINENKDNICRKRLYIDTIKYRIALIRGQYTRNEIEAELNDYLNELLDDTGKLLSDFGFRYVHLNRKVVE